MIGSIFGDVGGAFLISDDLQNEAHAQSTDLENPARIYWARTPRGEQPIPTHYVLYDLQLPTPKALGRTGKNRLPRDHHLVHR